MFHPGVQELEKVLGVIFIEIDDFMEDRYGDLFPLHPNRLPRGATSRNNMDGLFNIGASFTAGYGSKSGRGYVLDIHWSTLSCVPSDLKSQVEDEVVQMLKDKLSERLPERFLSVSKENGVFKVSGDLGGS